MLRSFLVVAILGTALSFANVASACDVAASRSNRDWLKTNNTDASAAITSACNEIGNPGALLRGDQVLIAAYKDGESHNPSAQATVDGCTLDQLTSALCP
jgi:hypothetical protein